MLLIMTQLIGCGKKQEISTNSARSPVAAKAYNEANQLRQTDKEKAIALYTQAIKADAEFSAAYYNRGLTLAELGKIKEAKLDLERLKAMKSADAETLEQLLEVAGEFYKK